MLCKGLSRVEFSNKVQNCYEIGHVPIGRRHDIAHIGMSRPIGALFSFIVVLNLAAGTQLITERQLVVAGVADDASDVSMLPSLCHFSLMVSGSVVATTNLACFASHTLMRCKGLSRVEFSNKVQNCYEIGRAHV